VVRMWSTCPSIDLLDLVEQSENADLKKDTEPIEIMSVAPGDIGSVLMTMCRLRRRKLNSEVDPKIRCQFTPLARCLILPFRSRSVSWRRTQRYSFIWMDTVTMNLCDLFSKPFVCVAQVLARHLFLLYIFLDDDLGGFLIQVDRATRIAQFDDRAPC
jgi:hypothetical protein